MEIVDFLVTLEIESRFRLVDHLFQIYHGGSVALTLFENKIIIIITNRY